MGRIEAEVAAETIDVAPPPMEEDLYEPPHHYQPPPPPTTSQRSTPPPQPQPQQFPPPQQDVHHFPPPHQDYAEPPPSYGVPDKPAPAQFPPQYEVPDYKPPPLPMVGQLFTPAPQQQTGQYVPSGNQYMPQQQQQQQIPSQGIPMGVQQNQMPTEPWLTNIFDCMENPQNALITLFFPCVTFGQIAEILDSGTTSCGTSGMLYSLIACCIAMPCLMSCTYRSKLRSRFGLVESPAPDWAIHCFCEWCALCQEYRELEKRGYDPSIGWLGNVAKQQQQQQYGMTPPMQQRMF